MTTFSVTPKPSGPEVFRYNADQATELQGYEFATHDHTALPDEPVPTPPPPAPIRITKLAFRQRFTQTEKAMIELASADNPAASMQARSMAAALRAQLADQRDASHIDLSRADTRAGVHALEQAGLIAAGRSTVILDTPPAEAEIFNG